MRKGKFGICLWFYAALAFVLAFLQQSMLCILLLGFVIVAERDEWTSRQVMQATFLCLLGSFISGVLNIFSVLKAIPFAGTLFSGVFSFGQRDRFPADPHFLHHRPDPGGEGKGGGHSAAERPYRPHFRHSEAEVHTPALWAQPPYGVPPQPRTRHLRPRPLSPRRPSSRRRRREKPPPA